MGNESLRRGTASALGEADGGAASCAPSVVRRGTPEYLTVATIVAPWGVRGELKARIDTDFPERFTILTRVYLGPQRVGYELLGARQHKGFVLLTLGGCTTRNAAEELRDMEVQIPVSEAMPLGPGEHYAYEVQGLEVWTEDDQYLGRVAEILFTGSNPVYVVRGKRELLIPALKEVVLRIDLDRGRMTVRLPAGLTD